MANIKGAPTVGQTQLLLDGQASIVKAGWNSLAAIQAVNTAKLTAMFGDGTAANPGLGNADWFAAIDSNLITQQTFFRPDKVFKRLITGLGGFIYSFDQQVKNYLPGGRSFLSAGVAHAFDAWLTRQNGLFGGTTGTPAPVASAVLAAGWTLTPATGGSIPSMASGSAPRVVITQIGASDFLESPPSAASGQFAISGASDAYQILPAVWGGGAVVPAGVYKLGIYRQAVGGTGAYFWDQDVAVTPGQAYPTITLTNPDAVLRTDWQPPVWASCLLLPEAAALFALAYSTSMAGGVDAQPVYAANGMISALNVAAGRSDSFLGVGNTPTTGTFLSAVVTGASAATATAGGLQTANVAAKSLQGFAGALGLQARITAALSGAATVNVGYTFYNSVAGLSTPQAGSLSATFGATAAGTVAAFTVPTDANGNPVIITAVTLTSISGAGGSGGSFVIEAAPPRSY